MATENRTRITCDRCAAKIFDGPADKALNINRYSITLHFYSNYTSADEKETMEVCEACYRACDRKAPIVETVDA